MINYSPELISFPFKNVHGILTKRMHGNSNFPNNSFNFSFTVGDRFENVMKNRIHAANIIKVPLQRWIIPGQTHSSNVLEVNYNDIGSGAFCRQTAIPNCDALWTQSKNIALAVSTADCLVLTLFDPKHNAIAAVHSGWRGCADGIVHKLISIWQHNIGSITDQIIVWIGSYISGSVYEISLETAKQLGYLPEANLNWFKPHIDSNKLYFDQGLFVSNQLVQVGIKSKNIIFLDDFGYTDSSHHFSHRLEQGNTGRSIMAITLS